MARIARGDHGAFAVLAHRHSGRFYAHAWRMCGNAAEAEDCVQEAFLKLWRNPGAFDAARGTRFVTWFYRVVSNVLIDGRRRARDIPDGDAMDGRPDGGQGQDLALQDKARGAALEAAIRALPERQRMALDLCFYEGLSNAEAADIMDINVKALESLLMRAKKGLRESPALKGWLDREDGS